MKIHDISIEIKNGMVNYPENPTVDISDYSNFPKSRLSKIVVGSHTGTHLDAPSHVLENGNSIDIYPLENFIGECKVFDFSYLQSGELVKISDFEKTFDNNPELKILNEDRVLIKTSNSNRGYETFYEDFVAIDGDCADWLVDFNILLVGIDYLSIKKRGSSDNRAHTSFLEKKIPILEGINLKDVSEGQYHIFCPPLKISGIDGSPARAVLIDNN